VDKLYLFGSAAKGDLMPLSDVDFLVKFRDFNLKYYFENFLTLKGSLADILKRKVDLVEQQALKNPVLIRSIEKNKILVYGRAD
jgi:predicted nucleotidyltransferase